MKSTQLAAVAAAAQQHISPQSAKQRSAHKQHIPADPAAAAAAGYQTIVSFQDLLA